MPATVHIETTGMLTGMLNNSDRVREAAALPPYSPIQLEQEIRIGHEERKLCLLSSVQ